MMKLIAPIIIAIILIYAVARWIVISRRDKKAMLEELDAEPEEPIATGAVVVEKQVGGFYTGSGKTARYNTAHYVKFLTDDSEEVVYEVSQEKFAEIYEGQKGILVTVGKNFIDFGE